MAPALCNYLLKTLEDKRKKLTTLAQEQPSLQGTGEELRLTMGSAVPPEPGSLQCPGLTARAACPMDQESAGALREALPWTCAGQGWKAPGCVSGRCCPPMALARPAHCWTHTPQMLQRPRPHRKGHSRTKVMSHRLPFQARGLWNSVPRWLIQLALPRKPSPS